MKHLLILLILSILTFSSYSQDLESLGIKKGVKVNGSVNLNSVLYTVSGIEQRRDPFNWFLNANLNINLFGYNAPFSFSYSNANTGYSQPFNQFSFAPSYKWVKTYIGYSAMTFSNYTLAGHVFLGGGVELTPGKWKLAAMYGRLRQAVPFNLNDTLQQTNASFLRMGYGFKVGYEDKGDRISYNIFTAKDDATSIPFILPESQLTPQQNVAMSVNFRKKILKRFFIEGEYAVSAMNKDIRGNSEKSDTAAFKPTHNLISGLLPENSTNRYYDALNASVGYEGNWYALRVKFEQIAPEYQTLGAYYFNNDMRNITIMPSVRLFKNRLNLNANVGIQENNLDQERAATTKRVVGSMNANYLPNEFWNVVLNYSNFSSYTNKRPLQDPFFRNSLDTLNFYQVSQTTNATVIRNFGAKESPQSIMLTVSHQQANDNASYEGGTNQSDFISANASYSYSIVPAKLTMAISGNVYTTNAVGTKSTYWGPTVSLSKSLYQKTVRLSLASSYNETNTNRQKTSPILNNRLGLTYAPKSKDSGSSASPHNLSLGVNVLNRLQDTEQQKSFMETTGTVNYTYSF